MTLLQKGNRKAKILIVTDEPSAHDVKTGTPINGGAGTYLDQLLGKAGLTRSEVFITHIVHESSPIRDFSYWLRQANIMKLVPGLMQLKADIASINPNVIVALGPHALKILTNKVGIDKWRGSILPCTLVPGHKVVGTYHPSFMLKVYDYKAIAGFDFRRVVEESHSRAIVYPERLIYLPGGKVTYRVGTEWVVEERAYDVDEILNDMLGAEYLSTDIECHPDDHGGWQLTCCGFSDRHERALVIDAFSGSNITRIARACAHPIKKVFQNGTFDYTVLAERGIICNNFAYDTMLGHHTLFAESSSGQDENSNLAGKKRQAAFAKGLGFQTSIYTREPYYKDDGKLWKITGDKDTFYRYNGLDCCVTKEIQDVQTGELKIHPGGEAHFAHEMSLVMPIIHAVKRGIKIDTKRRDEMKGELEKEIFNLQTFLEATIQGPLNVKSGPAVQHLLYEQLKLPKQYTKRKKKDGTYEKTVSADKDALGLLAAKHKHPVLLTILAIRERRDVIERYYNIKLDPDGRMRSSFDITGTRTSRLSSRASLSGSGTNFQNITEEAREMFVADPGQIFLYRDYSQAEARVVAYLARCQGLIELFEDPTRDIHCENAARIFKRRIPKLIKDGGDVTDEERYLAKRVVHASNYGMGSDRLVQIVNQDAVTTGVRIDQSMADMLIDTYFAIYPELKENFWKEIERELKSSRTLHNPFGWARTFYGRIDNQKALNEAYAHPPQSAIGVLCGMAWYRVNDAIRDLDAMVLINVHDSLLITCPIDKIDEVNKRAEAAMNIPMTIHGQTFTIPTDSKVGFNWGNKKKDGSNPNGLRDYDKYLLERAS